jgi:hypothetical protein
MMFMAQDPVSLLRLRRKELAAELEELAGRMETLRQEDAELEAAAKVLARFDVNANVDEYFTLESASSSDFKGKPVNTPTTPSMILQLLREAHIQGKPGLEPREMMISISRRWWPSVKSEDVGPTAWRMWKDGRLLKEGSLYMISRDGFQSKEAADLPQGEDAAASVDRG